MDICILGAGPGGAMAALHLARVGQPCLLLERDQFPRDKVCGDALSGKVLSELRQLGGALPGRLAEVAAGAATWGVHFVAPNGRAVHVPYKLHYDPATSRPDGYVLPRLDFDNLLVEEVRRQPLIELRENCAVARTERGGPGWRLFDKAGALLAECRLLLVANGAQSAFVRQVAGQPLDPAHHCAGLRAYYTGIEGLGPERFLELHFLPELLPAYLWIFPLAAPGTANVGIGLLTREVARQRLNLRERLADMLATHPRLAGRFAQAQLQGPVRGWGLPMGSRRRKLAGEGYLLLGDAGSLIDPFSGEGISHAMLSGRHAADWAGRALAANNLSAKFLRGYETAVYRRLGAELRLSTFLQKLVSWPGIFNFIATRAANNPALAETLTQMFTSVELRAQLRRPGFYWRLLRGK